MFDRLLDWIEKEGNALAEQVEKGKISEAYWGVAGYCLLGFLLGVFLIISSPAVLVVKTLCLPFEIYKARKNV